MYFFLLGGFFFFFFCHFFDMTDRYTRIKTVGQLAVELSITSYKHIDMLVLDLALDLPASPQLMIAIILRGFVCRPGNPPSSLFDDDR